MTTPTERLLAELIKAIYARDVNAARAALDAGADPNGIDSERPLRAATTLGDEAARNALTALLLERGADPNDRGPDGHDDRPVFLAAYCGYEAVVRMLLDKGGFPRDAAGGPARNGEGSSLLSMACASGMRWLVDLALAESCRADEIDNYGSTALHHAAEINERILHVPKDTAGLIELLIDRGAPIEQQRPGDWGTAMHWAVKGGDPAAVRTLVARGAALEAQTDQTQQTPLHQGARWGKEPTVRAALDLGADIKAVDSEGRAVLHFAAQRADNAHQAGLALGVIEALLAAGANANARDNAGRTPLEVAVSAATARGRRRKPLEPSQADLLAALVARTPKSIVAKLKLPR